MLLAAAPVNAGVLPLAVAPALVLESVLGLPGYFAPDEEDATGVVTSVLAVGVVTVAGVVAVAGREVPEGGFVGVPVIPGVAVESGMVLQEFKVIDGPCVQMGTVALGAGSSDEGHCVQLVENEVSLQGGTEVSV